MSPLAVLEEARRVLLTHGWAPGAYATKLVDTEEPIRCSLSDFPVENAETFCLVGACRQAVYNLGHNAHRDYAYSDALNALYDTILADLDDQCEGVEDYNDERGRTREDILTVLNLTIDRLLVAEAVHG